MREWKRILLSPVWLGVLTLLVVCHGGLFLQNQSVRAGGDLARYSQETNRWEAELQSLSLSEGQARLAEARQARSGWDMARMVITFEEAGLTIQEEELDYYRAQSMRTLTPWWPPSGTAPPRRRMWPVPSLWSSGKRGLHTCRATETASPP